MLRFSHCTIYRDLDLYRARALAQLGYPFLFETAVMSEGMSDAERVRLSRYHTEPSLTLADPGEEVGEIRWRCDYAERPRRQCCHHIGSHISHCHAQAKAARREHRCKSVQPDGPDEKGRAEEDYNQHNPHANDTSEKRRIRYATITTSTAGDTRRVGTQDLECRLQAHSEFDADK